MLAPSQRNQTGLGCGVPSAATVVSQINRSSPTRSATRAPKGVLVSMSTEVSAVELGGAGLSVAVAMLGKGSFGRIGRNGWEGVEESGEFSHPQGRVM